jgi:hypothetical protein
MQVNQKYAVWLDDQVARAFLGIDTEQPQTRWVALGECIGEEGGVGFWFRIDRIEQWTAIGETRLVSVSPPDCLIRWSDVITIQALGNIEELRVSGFKMVSPSGAQPSPARRPRRSK